MKKVTIFAPATVANVCVGFDILGFSFDSVGDTVTVEHVDDPLPSSPVVIQSITGITTDLPFAPEKNTATVGLLQMITDLKLEFGFKVSIKKGIPKGSGMGGSAASAVAAVVAANALLDEPLAKEHLLGYALAGERVASGAIHADNIAPCLLGGMQLVQCLSPLKTVSLPVPPSIYCIIVHPHLIVETKEARKILNKDVPLGSYVKQSAALASFITGCFRNDIELIRASLLDVIIEPQRAHLINGFTQVKKSALDAGAVGCGISGSGPSLFAWAESETTATKVQASMMEQFKLLNILSEAWLGKISLDGARRIL